MWLSPAHGGSAGLQSLITPISAPDWYTALVSSASHPEARCSHSPAPPEHTDPTSLHHGDVVAPILVTFPFLHAFTFFRSLCLPRVCKAEQPDGAQHNPRREPTSQNHGAEAEKCYLSRSLFLDAAAAAAWWVREDGGEFALRVPGPALSPSLPAAFLFLLLLLLLPPPPPRCCSAPTPAPGHPPASPDCSPAARSALR